MPCLDNTRVVAPTFGVFHRWSENPISQKVEPPRVWR